MKNKNDKNQLEKFKKDFCKLLAKYPDVFVANNIRGDLLAYGKESNSVVLPSSLHDCLAFNAWTFHESTIYWTYEK